MTRKILLLLIGGLLSLPTWAIQYQYDELHRLKRVQYDNGASIDYGYDPAGNIVSIAKIAGNGLAITGYTATGAPTAGGTPISVDSLVSPIIVTGLTNRVSYSCSLLASNAAGSGSESLAATKKAGVLNRPHQVPLANRSG